MTYPLEQVQRWMQTVLMHPGGVVAGMDSAAARQHIDLPPGEIEQVVARSQALDSVERLEIYARAYYARLVECLEAEFPVLAKAVGEDLFREFAVGYLESFPSRSYTLNFLGQRFADYLAETFPAGEESDCAAPVPGNATAELSRPEANGSPTASDAEAEPAGPAFLIDLARLEWAFSEVFDGPGAERVDLPAAQQWAALPPEAWADARLVPVPCLRLLELDYPVQDYYQALRADAAAVPPSPAKTFLAISRRDYIVRHYPLTRVQHVLLGAILSGATVAEAISAAAELGEADPQRLAEQLRQWFRFWGAEGFFLAIE